MRSNITHVIPKFTDPLAQASVLKDMQQYAGHMGFSPSEMANIRDRRVLLMVYKAMKLDELHHSVTGEI